MTGSRPTTAPDFLLSRAHGSVRTQGAAETFSDPDPAIAALRAKKVPMIVGAIPFERGKPVALTVPKKIIREDGPLEPPAYYRQGPKAQLFAQLASLDPSPEEHLERVAAAIRTMANTDLKKVVLARAVDIAFNPPVDPLLLGARLIDRSYNRDGFIADLSPAGEQYHGVIFVGSSPEVLIKKQGSTISAFPLAGTAAREKNPAADATAAQQLLRSAKDLHEHSYVVEHLREILSPLCANLDIPAKPQLMRTNELWHLATPIVGTLRDSSLTALELAIAVHPTPAICGTPTDMAEGLILTAESDRGFYAGAVGWADDNGDGEFMVAIRCAAVAADGSTARAWAGGGLVAESDPYAELAETTAKLRTIMNTLGL
ncbi:isochorismate synthase [Corynebacterium caspium]|uniref:isochorismate synthase n=1 Tax=Corynebacterium caspium TaxID=234828 RepID=UPI0003798FD8|nr:isochorismate synthase [Corynebacterium caspium]WKD59406.1 Isochorismate synthase DhbC [Corynebacterium caspium DSM 44850]